MTERHAGVSDLGISTDHDPGGPPAGPDPRDELAAALRRVIAATVSAPVPDDDIRAATVAAEALADQLEQAAGPGRRPRSQPDPAGDPQAFFPTSPVIGYANPLAPPVHLEAVDGALHGTAYFDVQYEGPPTCVHGGVIALVFDEMLGSANILAGNPAMTGTLTIRYRQPTPLRTELRLEARCDRRDGRKIYTTGEIYHGDVLTAEAEGVFIELRPDRFLSIVSQSGSPELAEQLQADARRLGLTGPPDA